MSATIQVRRGTASQWTSANPTLAAGEIGFESDTFKIKIGNGSTAWNSLQYAAGGNQFDTNIIFEGATADAYETTLQVTDPTADRTITLPDASGTVITTGNLSSITSVGTLSSLTISGDLTVNGTTTTINSTAVNVNNQVIFEGTTADAFETTLTVVDPTADRTITFPDSTGQVVLRDTTDTLTNKTINLTSNTLITTLAQLNTAVSDADVASIAGTETLTNKTLTLPVIDNPKYGYSTTATAAGTTTLTASSNYLQFFTGTTTQIIVLPVASTMTLGQGFYIENLSTGNLTVNSSGGNLVATVIPGGTMLFTCVLTSGTTAASWDADWHGFSTITGTGANVLGTAPTISNLVLSGTLNAGGGNGTNGQVLQSTGTGVQWGTASAAGAGLQDIFMMMGA